MAPHRGQDGDADDGDGGAKHCSRGRRRTVNVSAGLGHAKGFGIAVDIERIEDDTSEVRRQERLDEVARDVARPPPFDVLDVVIPAEDDHVETIEGRGSSDEVEDVPSGHVRESEIEDQEIRSMRFKGRLRLGSGPCGHDLEVELPEGYLDESTHHMAVVDG